jgi:vacuolar-type H+-ATPase subunit D/Vma8
MEAAGQELDVSAEDIVRMSEMPDDELDSVLYDNIDDTPEEQAEEPETEEQPEEAVSEEQEEGEPEPEEEDTSVEGRLGKMEKLLAAIEERNKTLESENAEKDRQIQEKERFAQRLGNEKGELNSKLQQFMNVDVSDPALDVFSLLTEEEKAEYDNRAVTSASDANSYLNKIVGSRYQLLSRYQNEQRQEELGRARQDIDRAFPNFKELIPLIVELAEEDGTTENGINAFKRDPYGSTDPQVTIGYAKRAVLTKENAALKKENEELKAKLKGLPKKISAAVNTKPIIGKGGSVVDATKKFDTYTPQSLQNVSDEELEEVLKHKA